MQASPLRQRNDSGLMEMTSERV